MCLFLVSVAIFVINSVCLLFFYFKGGYLLHTTFTHKYVFDYREGDVYACMADVGYLSWFLRSSARWLILFLLTSFLSFASWITGHSYIVYGPLSNGATTVVFESLPTYPDGGRYWYVGKKKKKKGEISPTPNR